MKMTAKALRYSMAKEFQIEAKVLSTMGKDFRAGLKRAKILATPVIMRDDLEELLMLEEIMEVNEPYLRHCPDFIDAKKILKAEIIRARRGKV